MNKIKSNLENYTRKGGYLAPKAFDAEEQRLQAEFAGLDLTEEERAAFAEVLRLRIGNKLDQQQARVALMRLRDGLKASVKATVASALARGDEVSAHNDAGAKRIHSRDGLAALHANKNLTDRQFNAGLAYRRRYEAIFKGLRSQLDDTPRRSLSADQLAATARGRAKSEAERIAVEHAVLMRIRLHPVCLTYLRHVAGEGRSITSLSGSGKAAGTAIERLAKALDIAADILPQEAP
jgi:hypothetical protein